MNKNKPYPPSKKRYTYSAEGHTDVDANPDGLEPDGLEIKKIDIFSSSPTLWAMNPNRVVHLTTKALDQHHKWHEDLLPYDEWSYKWTIERGFGPWFIKTDTQKRDLTLSLTEETAAYMIEEKERQYCNVTLTVTNDSNSKLSYESKISITIEPIFTVEIAAEDSVIVAGSEGYANAHVIGLDSLISLTYQWIFPESLLLEPIGDTDKREISFTVDPNGISDVEDYTPLSVVVKADNGYEAVASKDIKISPLPLDALYLDVRILAPEEVIPARSTKDPVWIYDAFAEVNNLLYKYPVVYEWELGSPLTAIGPTDAPQIEFSATGHQGIDALASLKVHVSTSKQKGEATKTVTVLPIPVDVKIVLDPISITAGHSGKARAIVDQVGDYLEIKSYRWTLPSTLYFSDDDHDTNKSEITFTARHIDDKPHSYKVLVTVTTTIGPIKGEALITVVPATDDTDHPDKQHHIEDILGQISERYDVYSVVKTPQDSHPGTMGIGYLLLKKSSLEK